MGLLPELGFRRAGYFAGEIHFPGRKGGWHGAFDLVAAHGGSCARSKNRFGTHRRIESGSLPIKRTIAAGCAKWPTTDGIYRSLVLIRSSLTRA